MANSQLGLVWRASTNTGCFQVGGSRCWPAWPRLARLRKTCYHSCDTDSVRQSKRFKCIVNMGPLRVIFFLTWNEIFNGIGEKLLPIKAAPIARSNLWSVIGLWVKIWHRNKIACYESNPVQSSRSKSTTCPRKGHAQIRIKQHSNFKVWLAKAWKRGLAWFWIDWNQSLQPNWSLMKCDLSEERGFKGRLLRIESISTATFRWRRSNAWKWCLIWFQIDYNQSLQPNRSQMKCDVWKPCSDQD